MDIIIFYNLELTYFLENKFSVSKYTSQQIKYFESNKADYLESPYY